MSRRLSHLVIITSLLIAIMPTACTASTPAIIPTISNPFDEKVDIGGYALRIRCTGQGTPTVVIETGFGEPGVERESSSWTSVIPEIENTSRICVYDRAGLGASDVAPGENRTSQDLAKDLYTLLVNANIPGPYILVGHSLGGFNVRVFASNYADKVVGMVLVDSSHPDQWSAIDKVLPPESPDEPESLKRIRIIPPASLPEKMDILASITQVRAVKSLGNLPLVVLTHSPTWSIDPNLSLELSGKIEQVWENLQNDLAGLSSNSTHVIATRAGHYIQVDEPQLIIDAILKVIEEAKK
jgi:pimeloyl-ACP methyl ester carboxylesterase